MAGLLENIEIIGHAATVTSATSVGSKLIDMHDCDGCLFLFCGSSLSGSSKITAQIQGCTAASTAGTLYTYSATPISSSTGYGAAANQNYKILAVDLVKPTPYRYNRLKITGATSVVAAQEKFISIKYGMRRSGSTTLWDSTTLGIGCTTTYAGAAT